MTLLAELELAFLLRRLDFLLAPRLGLLPALFLGLGEDVARALAVGCVADEIAEGSGEPEHVGAALLAA